MLEKSGRKAIFCASTGSATEDETYASHEVGEVSRVTEGSETPWYDVYASMQASRPRSDNFPSPQWRGEQKG